MKSQDKYQNQNICTLFFDFKNNLKLFSRFKPEATLSVVSSAQLSVLVVLVLRRRSQFHLLGIHLIKPPPPQPRRSQELPGAIA